MLNAVQDYVEPDGIAGVRLWTRDLWIVRCRLATHICRFAAVLHVSSFRVCAHHKLSAAASSLPWQLRRRPSTPAPATPSHTARRPSMLLHHLPAHTLPARMRVHVLLLTHALPPCKHALVCRPASSGCAR